MVPSCLPVRFDVRFLKALVGPGRMRSFLATALLLAVGTATFFLADPQDLSFIDALYLTIVTISTVGYGDISPSPDVGMRTFTVLFILVGSGYAFSELANALDGVLEAFTIRVKRFLKRTCGRDRTAETGDGTAGQEVTGRSLGIGGVSLDLDGDGTADFIQPPRAFVFWAQELLPAFLLLMLVQIVSAAVFSLLEPDTIGFGTALYHCFITATTVGYGDVPLTTPEVRLFACFHILVSVSWLAALMSSVSILSDKRNSQLQRARLFTQVPERTKIMALDVNGDGDGVDEIEFIVGMLSILGVTICGEPLGYNDVRPFRILFERLDVSKTKKLSQADLEAYASNLAEQAAKRGQDLNTQPASNNPSRMSDP